MYRSPLEDGTTAVYNDDGTLAAIENPSTGKTWLPDSSIVGDFFRNVSSTVSSSATDALKKALQGAPAAQIPTPGVATPQQKQAQTVKLVILVVLAALLAKKFLA